MDTITLQNFIQRTLVEVAQGVRGANKELAGSERSADNVFQLHPTGGDRKQHGIEFDVAITASKAATGTSGFMVILANLGGGASTEHTTENELVHRIKFEVGLTMYWS